MLAHNDHVISCVCRYSYQSIYLFNCFTTLIDLAKQAATLLGNSQRVADFIQTLEFINDSDLCNGESFTFYSMIIISV